MQLFTNTNYNFIRWRWPALALSLVVIGAGVVAAVQRGGIPLGIDFSGGTIVIVRFAEPVGEDRVRSAIEALPGEKSVQRYGEPQTNQLLIRMPQTGGNESLSKDADQIIGSLGAAGLPKFDVVSTEVVGPVVGADLQRRGLYATLLAIAAITLYIAVRFRPSFALGSVVATFHDVLVTLSFLVMFNYEMSLNVIAAMLAMVGYSVNDMIVIFDRVRENSRSRRRESLETLINTSLNQTLSRTVITSGTVFLSVLALYVFGGEVLAGFSFTMLVGTLATTYSGWFIAPSIAIMLSKVSGTRGAHAAVESSTAVEQPKAQAASKRARAGRKRAS